MHAHGDFFHREARIRGGGIRDRDKRACAKDNLDSNLGFRDRSCPCINAAVVEIYASDVTVHSASLQENNQENNHT